MLAPVPAIIVSVMGPEGKFGYYLDHFPPQVCIPKNEDVWFYSAMLPIAVMMGVATAMFLVMLWTVHEVWTQTFVAYNKWLLTLLSTVSQTGIRIRQSLKQTHVHRKENACSHLLFYCSWGNLSGRVCRYYQHRGPVSTLSHALLPQSIVWLFQQWHLQRIYIQFWESSVTLAGSSAVLHDRYCVASNSCLCSQLEACNQVNETMLLVYLPQNSMRDTNTHMYEWI